MFHADNEAYQKRFAYLVNDPKLAKFGEGNIYSEEEYQTLLAESGASTWPQKNKTCVTFVPIEVIKKELDNPNSNFSRLVSTIKNSTAWQNNKLFFNPFNRLHFSYGFADYDLIDADKITKALKDGHSYTIQMCGFNYFPHINGRLFLRICPELTADGNRDLMNRQALVREAAGVIFTASSGFLNLKSNLSAEEKTEIDNILKQFQDKPLLEFKVDTLSVRWVADDLLIKTWEIGNIKLRD